MELYIGLMSGTSADGIDVVLVDFSTVPPTLIATHYTPYPTDLRQRILALCQPGPNEIERLGNLDVLLGKVFADAVNHLLTQQQLTPADIKAIGSHGQTIRHSPSAPHRFTVQIGDPNTLAALTHITTIADFRRKDMAHGGQGAPLVPAFHQYMLATAPHVDRVVVNIGGIANITCLSQTAPFIGFDTGPGNILLDAWIDQHQQLPYDQHGDWAAQGKVDADLLTSLLSDPYFQLSPPKSTGREYFHLAWLTKQIDACNLSLTPVDIQATVTELTAKSIVDAALKHISQGELLVCGGGVHNRLLMARLIQLAASHFTVMTTEKYGMPPDWLEAMAFAWLARQTLHQQPGNCPTITGATQFATLGGIYTAS